MDSIMFTKINQYYDFIIHELADKRTADYFLVNNPFHAAFTVFFYIYFVQKLGPQLMKNRQPFELKAIMIVYNIMQILLNLYIFAYAFIFAYGPTGKYSLKCQPVDYSDSFTANLAVRMFHLYYMTKLFDFMDTVFMVLRKKYDHITFLHVYHHAGMFSLCWGAVKYYPGGHAAFLGLVNSFIHTIMYSYYLLTLIWTSRRENLLRWKKYLTILQIAQFVIVGFHFTIPLFIDCNYPRLASFFVGPQAIFLTLLFGDFYIKAYMTSKSISDQQMMNKKNS